MQTSRDSHRQAGQALIESLIVSAIMVTLATLVVILGKYQSVDLAAVGAARNLAFECAILPERCASANARESVIKTARVHHFTNGDDSLSMLHPWTTRRGKALLQASDDVSIEFNRPNFDAGRGAASTGPGSAVGSALHLLSNLAGPAKFDLRITGGMINAQVQVNLLRSAGQSNPEDILTGMALSPRSRNAILTDAWNASTPYGAAATTVATRVNKGKQLAAPIEAALALGYAPTKAFIGLMGTLSLEDKADQFRHHEVDMDLVPADRLAP